MHGPWNKITPIRLGDLPFPEGFDRKTGQYRNEDEFPFPYDIGIQLECNDGERLLIGDFGDTHIRYDEGCGCCAGSRDEVIVAWRRLDLD